MTVGATTTTFTDFVGDLDTSDYYKFTLATGGKFSFDLTGFTGSVDVDLLDSTGRSVDVFLSSGAQKTLLAGTYYVQVSPDYGYGYGNDTNYSLSLVATPPPRDNAGNTLATARGVTVGTTTTTFADFVGDLDKDDYYKFTLATGGKFSLNLTGLTAGANVQLLDSTGQFVDASFNSGITNESIQKTLVAGTYYVQVYGGYPTNTNYSLSLVATPPPVDNAGNTLDTARVFTVDGIATTYTFTDFVGDLDENDFYRFSLSQAAILNVNLSGLQANADLILLDSLGTFKGWSFNNFALSESINVELEAGTYYVKVSARFGNDTNYQLSIFNKPFPIDTVGNTLATALNINLNNQQFTKQEFLDKRDRYDYYKFSTPNGGYFNLNLTSSYGSGDVDVTLLDSTGEWIDASFNQNTEEKIRKGLGAGTYYIKVYSYADSADYSMWTSVFPAPDDRAGNSLAEARNITVQSSSPLAYEDSVAKTIDPIDYYRFTLSGPSTFTAVVDQLDFSEYADIQLLDSNGGQIAIDFFGDTSRVKGLSLSKQLAAGTYYLAIDNSILGSFTNYRLNVAASPNINLAKQTFMVYIAGNDLEEFGINDFLEMSRVGSNKDINIVVQFDRTDGYSTSYSNWTDVRRGLVRTGNIPNSSWGESIGEQNMGSKDILQNFVQWSMTNFAAEDYTLVLWGHGNGRGVAIDDQTRDSISAVELSEVLVAAPKRINLVATDACLMSHVEFISEILNNTGIFDAPSVFVGSEESIPGNGYEYTSLLSALKADPTTNPFGRASYMVDSYKNFYNSNDDKTQTLSAISVSFMGDLTNALDLFASTFMNQATESDRQLLNSILSNLPKPAFGEKNGYVSYRDVGNLFSGIANNTGITANIRSAASQVLTAYGKVVAYNYTETPNRATGLTIELQFRKEWVFSPNFSSDFPTFAANTKWDEFLNWWSIS